MGGSEHWGRTTAAALDTPFASPLCSQEDTQDLEGSVIRADELSTFESQKLRGTPPREQEGQDYRGFIPEKGDRPCAERREGTYSKG